MSDTSNHILWSIELGYMITALYAFLSKDSLAQRGLLNTGLVIEKLGTQRLNGC